MTTLHSSSDHQASGLESQSSEQNENTSEIVKFYTGSNVLITGASGFLGKVILWKLIESVPDIGLIYVLIRSKNNVSPRERLAKLLKTKPFSPKYDASRLLDSKVVAIESDMTKHELGLTEQDKKMLVERVNIVIHSAASVKFDAPLKENMRDNVYGTKSIAELCDQMQNIKAFVHVSTAYSNCQLREIGEKILPIEQNIDTLIKEVESLPDNDSGTTSMKTLEGRPNTYTFTKAVAENLVVRHEGKYPISIVRPSIVISSANEPHPGWVDNVNGIGGLGCLAAIGLLRTIDWNYYATSDMVPVDYVANCIICAAYQVSTSSPDKLLIYNMTSGNIRPISWGSFFDMLRSYATKTPSNKIVRPMINAPRHNRANPVNFLITRIFSELLFAHIVDMILMLIGYKKLLVKITAKMHHGYKILKPFTTKEWIFRSENVLSLSDSLSERDKSTFKFGMHDFDWDKHADNTWTGARYHLLKEEPTEESFSSARKRQVIVAVVHYGLMLIFTTMTTFVGAKILRVI